jgi:SHS2 domain-containing protein
LGDRSAAGYEERAHTADWALDVWAPDLASLLEQAAIGMHALMGLRLKPEPRLEYAFEVRALDRESLLVSFLSELLYLGQQSDAGFDTFAVTLIEAGLHAQVSGGPLEAQAKEIKAVTYHNLAIHETARGLETTIVFDV